MTCRVFAMWIVVSLFYSYQYVLRVLPNIIKNDLADKFELNSTLFGQVAGVYYIGYALAHLPIGLLLDRYGVRKVLPGFMLITAVGSLPLVFSDNWRLVLLGRAMVGIGSSAAILGVFKVIRLNFKKERFSTVLGFSVAIGLVGAIYGGGPLKYLMQFYSFEAVVTGIALIGLVLSIVSYILIPKTKDIVHPGGVLGDLKTILSNFKLWLVLIGAGLMVGPLDGFPDGWSMVFFETVYFFQGVKAAALPGLIFLGMLVGSPILSYLADRFNAHLQGIILSAVVMGLGFCLLLFGNLHYILVGVVLFIIGIFCSYQILSIYKASTYVKEDLVGLTTSFTNMVIMIFGYFFHAVIGKVVHMSSDYAGSSKYLYMGDDYINGLTVIPVALALGIVLYLIVMFMERANAKN